MRGKRGRGVCLGSPSGWRPAWALCGIGAGQAQELVHFPSLDDRRTVLDGYLYRANGDGRRPAIVFLHGCSGMFFGDKISPRQREWAELFNSHGVTVLMVDSFGPRQHGEMCSVAGFDLHLYRDRPKDAYAALAWLQAQTYVRPDRVAALGWSQGGGVVNVVGQVRRASAGRAT